MIEKAERLAASLEPSEPLPWMLDCVMSAKRKVPSLAEKKGITKNQLESLYLAGFQLYDMQCYQEAADLFRLLCFYESRVASYWVALGGAYQHIKCHDNALAAFTMASLLDPSNPESRFYAAHSCIGLMNLHHALDYVNAAITLAKHHSNKKDLYWRALALKNALVTQIQLNSKTKNHEH
jgi:tetratricopeptide (TPR) repeat protein